LADCCLQLEVLRLDHDFEDYWTPNDEYRDTPLSRMERLKELGNLKVLTLTKNAFFGTMGRWGGAPHAAEVRRSFTRPKNDEFGLPKRIMPPLAKLLPESLEELTIISENKCRYPEDMELIRDSFADQSKQMTLIDAKGKDVMKKSEQGLSVDGEPVVKSKRDEKKNKPLVNGEAKRRSAGMYSDSDMESSSEDEDEDMCMDEPEAGPSNPRSRAQQQSSRNEDTITLRDGTIVPRDPAVEQLFNSLSASLMETCAAQVAQLEAFHREQGFPPPTKEEVDALIGAIVQRIRASMPVPGELLRDILRTSEGA
jgi:hypothetical protein